MDAITRTSSVFTATYELPAAVCTVDGHVKTFVNVDAVVARVADYRALLIPDIGRRGRYAVGVVAHFQRLVNVDQQDAVAHKANPHLVVLAVQQIVEALELR